ncbi:MAG: acyl-CoA thioesterase [Pseudomonadales bacterium]|nr:acyl-CoA thioesterase [Pseudomonadales bacterium]
MSELDHDIPEGELALQTIAMPGDANGNGDIFGGWVVSQMDLAAGVTARKRARGRVATVAIDAMTFLKPMKVGDIIGCYTTIERVGRSSMRIAVEVWKTDDFSSRQMKLTTGIFTFVAIDELGMSRLVPDAVVVVRS